MSKTIYLVTYKISSVTSKLQNFIKIYLKEHLFFRNKWIFVKAHPQCLAINDSKAVTLSIKFFFGGQMFQALYNQLIFLESN